jgi:hypothetical protein
MESTSDVWVDTVDAQKSSESTSTCLHGAAFQVLFARKPTWFNAVTVAHFQSFSVTNHTALPAKGSLPSCGN